MKIEKIYDYPPYFYLEQILKHCPQAAFTYLQLWKKRDKDNKIHLDKKDIRLEFLKSRTKIQNELLLIVHEGLANIDETPKSIVIELVGWDEEAEQYSVC
jgi:hypothetical protein